MGRQWLAYMAVSAIDFLPNVGTFWLLIHYTVLVRWGFTGSLASIDHFNGKRVIRVSSGVDSSVTDPVAIFSGGYIGVDVFFIITGFVMTNLLLKQFTLGTFNFTEFYSRRIKRLVPALLLMTFVVFFLISPIYMDEEYYIYAKAWLFSLVGYSNIYYTQEFAQYFAPAAETMPLLHTWSLAVEFQFYLIWPPLLLLTHKYLKKKMAVWGFMLLWGLASGYSVYRIGHLSFSTALALCGVLFWCLIHCWLKNDQYVLVPLFPLFH